MEFFILLIGVFLVAFIFWAFVFYIIPLFVGASYEGSSREIVEKMIEFSEVKKGERVAELGSGDGRLVIEFAKRGARVEGFEINPFLVLLSRRKIKKEGLEKNAKIRWKSFWRVDLKEFDVVSVFQIGYVMPRLERKLKRELRKGARVVSNKWKFRNWKPGRNFEGGTGVRVYRVA